MAIRVQRLSKHRLQRARALRGKRAVSEVIGTILILALTVVLFSSIFFFVSTFPRPANQPASQFQGQLYYSFQTHGGKSWTNVSFLTITHLGGPNIYAFSTQIYVVSQAHPQSTTKVYNLSSGGFGSSSSASWGVGQTWNVSLGGDGLTIPDNITVTIVAANLVVYRQTLPGTNPTIPPIYDNEGTIPGNPKVNQTFSIWVQIFDPFLRTTSQAVYLNLTSAGLTCGTPLGTYPASTGQYRFTYNASTGLWVVPGCSSTTAGTYYVTAWVTDTNPIQVQQNSIIFPVQVGGTGGGGGGCGSNTWTAVIGAKPLTVGSSSGSSTVYLNVTNGNTCTWFYISATITVTRGTMASSGFTNDVVPVGSPGVLQITDVWTGPGGSASTAKVTITLTSSTGWTGNSPLTITITY